MIEFNRKSFVGGLNQQVDATRLSEDEYPLLINGRNRYDVLQPVQLPQQIIDSTIGNRRVQGAYSVGSILIVFAGGLAFYKDQNYPNANYNQINGFAMSADVAIIYAELVPISTLNFVRIPQTAGQANTDIKLTTPIKASPAGLVVQDGVNQPYLIDSNMTSRPLNKYDAWELDNREYVPIGTQMIYSGGILYIVDGSLILRSVTGRPLDFMVIIKEDGTKEPQEADGGARNAAISVDYNQVTCIARLPADDNSFFVSTSKAAYAVTPLIQPEDLIYGEPDFISRFLFTAGATSPFAFVELIGDNAFVDFNGLRSFNAIKMIKTEGINSPFSKKVGPILQGIFQDYTAAIVYDNYALFGVNTIFGRGIIIYDTLNEVFAGVDLYPGVGQILKFEEVRTAVGRKLFFVTTDGKFYEAFASTETATCKFYLGDHCTNNPDIEQRPWKLKLVFVDCLKSGTVYASSYTDRKFGTKLSAVIEQRLTAVTNQASYENPLGSSDLDTVQVIDFDFTKNTLAGWKHGFLVEWDVQCKLTHAKLESVEDPNISSPTQQVIVSKRNREALDALALTQ